MLQGYTSRRVHEEYNVTYRCPVVYRPVRDRVDAETLERDEDDELPVVPVLGAVWGQLSLETILVSDRHSYSFHQMMDWSPMLAVPFPHHSHVSPVSSHCPLLVVRGDDVDQGTEHDLDDVQADVFCRPDQKDMQWMDCCRSRHVILLQ